MTKQKPRIFTKQEEKKLQLAKKVMEAGPLIKQFDLTDDGHKVKITFQDGDTRKYRVEDFIF